MRLTQIVEALLFASDAPLTAADIARIDERLDEDTVEAVVQELRGEYEETERAFQIYEVAGGYQLLTRPDFAMHLERFETVPQTTRLSNASLEALAIIAYRQPIGRAEVEEIRGVGSSGAIKTLIDRNLVEITGRGEGLGRPLLYGTTRKFLEHFGLRSLEDMPRPEELPVVLRTRTEPAAPELAVDTATADAGIEPATADAGVEPATAEAGVEPVTPEAEAEPVTSAAEAEQVTSEAEADQATPEADADDVAALPDADTEPATDEAPTEAVPDTVEEPDGSDRD